MFKFNKKDKTVAREPNSRCGMKIVRRGNPDNIKHKHRWSGQCCDWFSWPM